MSFADLNESHMRRALELAVRSEGRTHPNPMVGCVIVDGEGQVVAEGYHREAGLAHAEVEALKVLGADVDASRCTLYVNLEPCSHFNRTPPCTEAIYKSGVGRVVVGTIDPNPKVSGSGLDFLRKAGVDVVSGVLEDECRALNRAFFTYITEGRPLVVAKYAMTLDGKIATSSGDSRWISNEESRRRVHELRGRTDAILVGSGTLRSDDPRLSCRIEGGRDPIRVLIDRTLESVGQSRAVRQNEHEVKVVVFASDEASPERRAELEAFESVVVHTAAFDSRGIVLAEMLGILADVHEITSLMVEGGGRLLGSFFDHGLIDRVYAFVAPTLVGGDAAPGPVLGAGVAQMDLARRLSNVQIERFGDNVLFIGDVKGV